MKKIFFLVSILVVSISSFSQKRSDNKVTFNAGGEVGIATGNLGERNTLSTGATAQLEYELEKSTYVLVNGGVIEYFGKKVSNSSFKYQSSTAIPILGGVKYFFADNFYGNAQIGVSLFTGLETKSRFTYSPGLGFKINSKTDALLKYTGYAGAGGAFGVRVGFML